MSDPTLFDIAPRLKVVDQGKFYGSPDWWAVKCLDCGKWLTKYDESREWAVAFAEKHRCDVS
jgi:hypothetical protein